MQKGKMFFLMFVAAPLLGLVLIMFACPVHAAELSVQTKTPVVKIGQLFEVSVVLGASGESVNAVDGKLFIAPEYFDIKSINSGNSIINLWIKTPRVGVDGQIEFSGIVPGGYAGNDGPVFSVFLQTKKSGVSAVKFNSARALLNDGAGTSAALALVGRDIAINTDRVVQNTEIIIDRDSPEVFVPQVASDPSIFSGERFLIFSAQDKGSGIDHYSVCEGSGNCTVAESPYLLKDQDVSSDITVKAVDKSDNERLAVVKASPRTAWPYVSFAVSAILIVILFIFFVTVWRASTRPRLR